MTESFTISTRITRVEQFDDVNGQAGVVVFFEGGEQEIHPLEERTPQPEQYYGIRSHKVSVGSILRHGVDTPGFLSRKEYLRIKVTDVKPLWGEYHAWRGIVAPPKETEQPTEIPDGLTPYGNEYSFKCFRCGEPVKWEGDLEDFDINNPANLCGSSPRCCP